MIDKKICKIIIMGIAVILKVYNNIILIIRNIIRKIFSFLVLGSIFIEKILIFDTIKADSIIHVKIRLSVSLRNIKLF